MSKSMVDDDRPEAPEIFAIPIDWQNMRLIGAVRALRIPRDGDNYLKGMPTVIMGPNPSNTLMNIAEVGSFSDDLANGSDTGLLVKAMQYILGSASHLERVRTPLVWKTTTGNTGGGVLAQWTPAGGKKFRLMGFTFVLSKEAACAGAFVVEFRDNATPIFDIDISHAVLVATGQVEVITVNFPGNGYLSAAADNVLGVNLATLTAGSCSIVAWGTEE